jgi:hypothetical protein
MKLRRLAGTFYKRRIELFDKLNQSVEFNSKVPQAFASAKHFVNPDAGSPMQSPGVKIPFYHYVNDVKLHNVPVDYLEFGVFQGWSMKQWLEINTHGDSRFVGFDTFTGLPESWMKGRPAGHFNVNGNLPDLHDSRLRFVRGLFQETLPGFIRTFRNERQLVVHIDCDLYSSTLFCLASLHPYMPPGTILIFDEFYDVMHEFAGFHEYFTVFMRKWQAVAYRDDYIQAAIELL